MPGAGAFDPYAYALPCAGTIQYWETVMRLIYEKASLSLA